VPWRLIFAAQQKYSHHLEALLVSKDAVFKKEKESARRTARSHTTLEKSSKNYIRCENEPSQAAIHSVASLTSSQVATADFPHGEGKCASCRRRGNSPWRLASWRRQGGVICGLMPFNNETLDWAKIQHEDGQ
jgi:hypothetical protein